MDIRRARREDLTEVDALLKANSLPPLPMQFSLSNVLVALDQGSVIGAIALEVVARRGLLQPAAVSQAYQDGTAGDIVGENAKFFSHIINPNDISIGGAKLNGFFTISDNVLRFVFKGSVISICQAVDVEADDLATIGYNESSIVLDGR